LLGLIGVLSRRVRPQYGKYIDINRHLWILMPYLFLWLMFDFPDRRLLRRSMHSSGTPSRAKYEAQRMETEALH
jgi:hypothetical protein